MFLNFFSHGRKLDGAKFFLSGSSTLSSSHNSPTTQGSLVFVVVFSKMFKACCFVCGKLFGFKVGLDFFLLDIALDKEISWYKVIIL